MATNQETGGSPTQQTGVEEVTGPLKGDQSYQILLDREMAREAEDVVEEAEPIVEVPNELPEEVPTEDEESQAEPAEEVEEEQPEEVEEPEPEEDEVLSKSADEEPRIPQKRLNKEVARRKSVEERLQRSQARIAELEATAKTEPVSQPSTPKDTMPEVDSLPALIKVQEEAEDAIDYIEGLMDRQPDAVNDAGDDVYTAQGGAQYTREDLGGMRANARRKLRREIPQKRNFLNQRVTAQQQATERHSWLADNTSNDYHQYQAIKASRPWIMQSDPSGPLLIGAMVEGLKVMRQRAADAKKPATTKKKEVAPHVDTTSAAPKRVVGKDGRRRKREARESKMFSKGKLESRDVTNFFLQREQERE